MPRSFEEVVLPHLDAAFSYARIGCGLCRSLAVRLSEGSSSGRL